MTHTLLPLLGKEDTWVLRHETRPGAYPTLAWTPPVQWMIHKHGRLFTSLVSFNVGIELGQAAIVAVLFPLLVLVRRWDWSALAQATAGSAAAAVGLFWFTERVLGG